MKKNKMFKIVWIFGIYVILTLILYLVVLYKVQWEHKDLNTYLYFYNCNGNLCTSDVSQSDYFSKIICDDDICPFINDIIDNNVILESNGKMWLYNYVLGNTIDKKYNQYRRLSDTLFAVKNNSLKEGIINSAGEVIVEPQYEYIDSYKDGYVVYKKDSLYGIDSSAGEMSSGNKFNDVVLINSTMYAGVIDDGLYKIYSHFDGSDLRLGTFKYIFSVNDIIFTFNNNKIDILTTDFDSTLVMKINSFFSYSIEKERETLNFRSDGQYIYFDVFTNENEYVSYKYSIDLKKIIQKIEQGE